VTVFSVLFPSITRLCNVAYLLHVNKQLVMLVTGEGTPLQTEECRIPYAEEYLESTFRMFRTQGSTPTYSHYVLYNINAPDTARKVSVSCTDQDTDYFESYCSFPRLFQANSRPPPINSAVHNVLIIPPLDVIIDSVIK